MHGAAYVPAHAIEPASTVTIGDGEAPNLAAQKLAINEAARLINASDCEAPGVSMR